MIKVLAVSTERISIDDEGEEYVYPRCLFPAWLEVGSVLEYEDGRFVVEGVE